ncbi:unnamed protein product [Prorocentrum cordatum]|uniref:Uncharacterized protein n=1 Tax=Prorocentrum cordatum TaxID=2364126 RepID=A0ABN9Q957_9DINO|nr:unnamed protein product [Polarella glacialis]
MALADSDAESSQDLAVLVGAKPRFKQLGRGAGRRRAPRRFSFEAALQGALGGGFSSEDEAPTQSRPAAAAAEASGAEGAPVGEGAEGDFVAHARPKAEKRPKKEKAEKAEKGGSRKRRADKEESAAEGPACEGAGAREGLQEEIRRKREKVLASRRAKQEAAGKENAPQRSFKAQLQEAVGGDGSAGEAGAAVKGKAPKRKAKPVRTRVVDGDTPEKDKKQKGEGSSPDDAVRFHLRGVIGGKGGGKGGGGGDDESGSEVEPDEEEVRAWRDRLAKRADPDVEGIKTAFSLKVCDPRAIRRLGVESFLGERGMHEGGKLLCDDEGKPPTIYTSS